MKKVEKKKIQTRKSAGNEVVTLTMFCFRISTEPKTKKKGQKIPKKNSKKLKKKNKQVNNHDNYIIGIINIFMNT